VDRPSRADVRATYERISTSFASARRTPWPEVVQFVDSLPEGAKVLDLGCGNGRHTRILRERGLVVLALDFSRRLLELGRGSLGPPAAREVAWIEADAVRLPLRDASVDAAVCVAVLHHLPTPDDRRTALEEIRRVLVPGGPAFLSVWDRDQPRFQAVPAKAPGDVEVPWTLPDGSSVLRYYHLFRAEELRAMIIESGLQGETFLRGSGNIFALARRHG